MPTAFFITPFSPASAGDEKPELFDRVQAAIRDAAHAAGVELVRADDIFAAGVVIEQVRAAIETADCIVAICTGRNPNVFYELGVADMAGHRPVLVASGSHDLPFDVAHWRTQFYDSTTVATLASRVQQAIQQTLAERAARSTSLKATAVAMPPAVGATAPAQDVVARGYEALAASEGVWLYVAVTPDRPASDRLSSESVQLADAWLQDNRLVGPLGGGIPAYGRPVTGPGKVTFTGGTRSSSEDDTIPRDAYVELYMTGAALVALPVVQRTSDSANVVGEFTLVQDVILANDLALSWAAHQTDGDGLAVIQAGLVDASRLQAEPLTVDELVLATSDYGNFRRLPGTRTLNRAPLMMSTASLSDVGSVAERLLVAREVAAGLLQHFGLAEPAQIRSDGTLVLRQWTTSNYRQVEHWAKNHQVPCERLAGG